MDAVKFMKERNRMCKASSACAGCALHDKATGLCPKWCFENPEEAVAAVEKWAKEHPRKTRQSEFLKMFPNVMLNSDGQPYMCPRTLDNAYHPDSNCILDVDVCRRCREKFWNQEVE